VQGAFDRVVEVAFAIFAEAQFFFGTDGEGGIGLEEELRAIGGGAGEGGSKAAGKAFETKVTGSGAGEERMVGAVGGRARVEEIAGNWSVEG
jgi:hypothetical protein